MCLPKTSSSLAGPPYCTGLPQLEEHRQPGLSLLSHFFIQPLPAKFCTITTTSHYLWNCDCQRSPVITNCQISGLISSFTTCPLFAFDIINHTLTLFLWLLWWCSLVSPDTLATPFTASSSFCSPVVPVTAGLVLIPILLPHTQASDLNYSHDFNYHLKNKELLIYQSHPEPEHQT